MNLKHFGKFSCLIFLAGILIMLVQDNYAQNASFGGLDPNKRFSQFTYHFWNIENGLPGNEIQDIIKTSEGYIWIATLDGLVRYDGIKFDYFDQAFNGLNTTNREILSLFEDNDNNLWIGTNRGGIIKYNQVNFETIKDETPTQKEGITSFAQTSDGIIWVGGLQGLAKIEEGEYKKLESFPSLINLSVNELYIDSDDNLWITTINAGLIKKSYDYIKQFSRKDGLVSNTTLAVHEDRNKQLWVGTDRGIMRMYQGEYENITQKYNLPKVRINSFLEDERGNIYVGSNAGIFRFFNDKVSSYQEADGLPHNEVTCLLDDKESGIWIGTKRGGIVRIQDGRFYNYGVEEGLCYNIVNAIYEEGDNAYLVGTDNGLSRFQDGKFESIFANGNELNNRVKDFLKGRNGNVWVATYGGLFKLNGKMEKKYDEENGLVSNAIKCLYQDSQDRIWVGTANGISIIDGDTLTKIDQDDGLLNNYVLSITEDNNQRIWIGTNGGGVSIFNQGEITNHNSTTGLSAKVVFDVYVDIEGLIWLSTRDGIISFDGQNFKSYDHFNKIINKSVFQVLEDKKGNMWFTSPKGIFVVEKKNLLDDKVKKEELIDYVKLYDKSYGLRTNSITGGSKALLDSQGKFWFPTLKGVSVIDPNNIQENQVPPKIAIEALVVNGISVPLMNKIEIDPGERNIELHYTGLNYVAPEKLKFKFKLENLDKEWVNAGHRRIAYYHNIPPGNYLFKVKAANEDGVWNDAYASIEITQNAHFYKSKWFYGLIGLLLLALGVLGYSFKIRNIQLMNKELARQVSARTKDLKTQKEELQKINSSKDKLLSIISHDLKGPLNSIKQMLGLLSSGNLTAEELKYLIGNITQDVGVSVNLLDNLLNWARSQMQGIKVTTVKIDVFEIVDENFKLFNYNFNKKKIVNRNNVPKDAIVYADYDMIKLVIRNLIANAIKFTPEEGQITVGCIQKVANTEICVSDTGIGISKENQENLFEVKEAFQKIDGSREVGTGLGLILSKEFIEKNGGTITVDSVKGKGSTFKICLPNQNNLN